MLRVSLLIVTVTACFAFVATSCTSHRVGIDPIEIKPIKVTVDVNVQVQRKLDDFFDFEDELVAPDSGETKTEDAKSEKETK